MCNCSYQDVSSLFSLVTIYIYIYISVSIVAANHENISHSCIYGKGKLYPLTISRKLFRVSINYFDYTRRDLRMAVESVIMSSVRLPAVHCNAVISWK